MPYNTRRKSLSLPALGIHIPLTLAERAAAQAAARAAGPAAASAKSMPPPPQPQPSTEGHPSKRLKRSPTPQDSDSDSNSNASSASRTSDKFPVMIRRPASQYTPPTSPYPTGFSSASSSASASASGSASTSASRRRSESTAEPARDEVVDAVTAQLRATGNRPHLARELALILSNRLVCVRQSANPSAMISARLANYMKRPCWTEAAPCPLGKELETVHPRRTYYYLTTCPRQPHRFTPPTELLRRIRIVVPSPSPPRTASPSLSEDSQPEVAVATTTTTAAAAATRRRDERSQSPEIDLSTYGCEDWDELASAPGTPAVSGPLPTFTFAPEFLLHPGAGSMTPLETDEREFTQMADGLQKRKLDLVQYAELVPRYIDLDEWAREDTFWASPAQTATHALTVTGAAPPRIPSPGIRPTVMNSAKKDTELARLFLSEWDQSAENIDMEELDVLFGST